MATKKHNETRLGEAVAKYRTKGASTRRATKKASPASPPMGEVFWLAFQQLSDEEQGVFVQKLFDDPEWYEDIYDAVMSNIARKESARPYSEVQEELIRDGLL